MKSIYSGVRTVSPVQNDEIISKCFIFSLFIHRLRTYYIQLQYNTYSTSNTTYLKLTYTTLLSTTTIIIKN
ncbi:hypothetical protein EYC84_008599 [Monilinia fructicola]|uniref:Uncharacterized protein n=1 Tax=Monilinia fructicola TaxID=38448 RepID=A0A5M9JFX8_MONFR|nr:hypothetical protein EYC84_008599 [Monilinia fructicola]